MGVKIYIWLAGNGNVGHGSMTLSDGTHISWWPKEDKQKTSKQNWSSVEAGPASSYNEDVEWEGKSADQMYEIPAGKLDEAAIKAWWDQFRDKSKYHILSSNCCSIVYDALKAGGATKYAAFPWNPISTPANLKEYADKLKKATT